MVSKLRVPQEGSRSNPDYNLSCCTRQKLLSARQGLLDDGIALQYLQLDDWWCVIHPILCALLIKPL